MITHTTSTTQVFPEEIQRPPIPHAIVEYLKKTFPDRLPKDITTTDRELGALIGEQRVIAHLSNLFLQQQAEEPLSHVLQQAQD